MKKFNLVNKTTVINPKLKGQILNNYALSEKAELFKLDEQIGVWTLIEVTASKDSVHRTMVQIDGQRKSLAVILAETFSIAIAEANAIVAGRYRSYYPVTYITMDGNDHE